MAEYISREFVLSCVDSFLSKTDMPIAAQYFYDCFRECKAADVQPVKHGRWSECYTDSHHYSGICTVCGKASIRGIRENPLEYCPKCGARMDGDING